MKKSLADKDWKSLQAIAHKLIPSFAIVGISKDFENMAKEIQEYASTGQRLDALPELVSQLEEILSQSCSELQEECNIIMNTNA
jgi:hypothetical protein